MPKRKPHLKTKQAIPQITGKILRRERLLDILKMNQDKELIIISADAGFGKTTLLQQFCGELSNSHFFYSLESSDSDLTALFERMLSGIKNKYQDFGRRTSSILGKTEEVEILAGTFINDFYESIDEPFYAIFDDYQYLQNSACFDRALDYMLSHAPPHFHVIIASRITPKLDLTRYLARQQLFRLEREQLKFDYSEIERLLRDIYKMHISKKEIVRIENHSEGWVTAIQLIMQKIAAVGEQNASQALDGYVASGKEIFSYFAHEVLEHQTEEIKRFLIDTSLCAKMTPEICDELLNIRVSEHILKKIENRHVFLSRSGEKTYRYNRLFRDYICGIASQHYDRKEIRDRNAKLGDIFERRSEYGSAIYHYIEGGKYRAAITCIKKVALELRPTGVHRKVLEWLADIPAKYAGDDLTLMLIKAEALDFLYEVEKALNLYSVLEQRARKEQNAKVQLSAVNGIAKINVSSRKFDQALQYIKKGYRIGNKYSIDKRELIKIYNLEGICHNYLGDLRKAEIAYNKGLDIISKYRGLKKDYVYLLNNITILSYIKGDFQDALRDFNELIKIDPNPLNHSTIHSNIASVLLDLGRFNEARKALKNAYTCSKQYMNKRSYLMFLYTLANYYLEISKYKKAELYYKRLVDMSRDCREDFTENVGKAGLMKTYYFQGNYAQAHRLLREIFYDIGIKLHIYTHGAFLYKALIELHMKQPEEAEFTLLKCLKWIEKTEYKFSLMVNCYYLAYLYNYIKNEKKALSFIERALEISKASGYDHTVISQARKDNAVIQFAVKKSRFSNYINDIMQRMYRQKGCSVRLLGSFEISINCMPIRKTSWQTEKARLVFAYLVLNRDRMISKDELAAEFYEQRKPSLTSQNIRKTISRLRRALMWDRAIIQTRGSYMLNQVIKFNVDTEEFENSVDEILNPSDGAVDDVNKKYRQVTRLYRSDFLNGLQNDWCERTRKRLKELYIKALQHISQIFIEQDEPEKVRNVCQEIIKINSIDELGNFGLVKSYIMLGMRGCALEKYRDFEIRLMKKQGIKPSKSIEEILGPDGNSKTK